MRVWGAIVAFTVPRSLVMASISLSECARNIQLVSESTCLGEGAKRVKESVNHNVLAFASLSRFICILRELV